VLKRISGGVMYYGGRKRLKCHRDGRNWGGSHPVKEMKIHRRGKKKKS